MTKQNINSKKGFTIIEVVLVLAIAGLIFLMVFVALPALQRSQRDTARRNDMARVSTSLVQYQTNYSSAASNLPVGPSAYVASVTSSNIDAGGDTGGPAKNFIQRYLNSGTDSAENTFKDPDGKLYNMFITDDYSDGKLDSPGLPQTGQIPTPGGEGYITMKLTPSNSGYTVGSDFEDHVVYIIPGATCDGETAVAAGKNNYAVLYRLEGAGVYCIDDQ